MTTILAVGLEMKISLNYNLMLIYMEMFINMHVIFNK